MEEDKTWKRPKGTRIKRKLLGDKVEELLEPLVNNFAPQLKGCGGCQKRKEMLNKLDEKLFGEQQG